MSYEDSSARIICICILHMHISYCTAALYKHICIRIPTIMTQKQCMTTDVLRLFPMYDMSQSDSFILDTFPLLADRYMVQV